MSTRIPSVATDEPGVHDDYRPEVPGLVSVVIPNYNHAQFVGDAIRSVLDQDYSNFEIIVVDDGSTDDSRAVVAQFGNRVQYIWQENQGLSAARNTGIRAAQGVYIAVLDADDLYEPGFLSALVSLLDAHPEADGVYCGYQFVDERNRLLPQREARLLPDGELYAALLDGNFLVPESVLVRRVCYEEVGGFDHTLTALEDWDMWLRITRDFTLVGTDQVLIRHRILSGSMSTDPTRMHLNRLAVLEKHLGPEPDGMIDANGDTRRAYGRTYLVSCIEYLQVGDTAQAYRCLQSMANVCPDLLLAVGHVLHAQLRQPAQGPHGRFRLAEPGREWRSSDRHVGSTFCRIAGRQRTGSLSAFRLRQCLSLHGAVELWRTPLS